MTNNPTLVFGHRNPDTDSVCSAISFSYLKNKLGDNTSPRVLGHINKETAFALNYFNVIRLTKCFLSSTIGVAVI